MKYGHPKKSRFLIHIGINKNNHKINKKMACYFYGHHLSAILSVFALLLASSVITTTVPTYNIANAQQQQQQQQQNTTTTMSPSSNNVSNIPSAQSIYMSQSITLPT